MYNLGIRIHYDLNLIRQNVFKYQEIDSFAGYLLEVQGKSRAKMVENLVYLQKSVQLRQPLSIHSGYVKV